ncbi:MAG: succinylglutamate desuccinylase [halophilic archaeon J07HX5]|jgi:Succinylglutamate desuccinylase|nr:MAG: succinylglutamate desuccinylase [halophilic archaeon J07HX5]
MRVNVLGAGNPQVAVVGAIHGDEPSGAHAIERFLSEEHNVQRPVKLIILNEPALEQNTRYIDVDVNRVLPGDPTGDQYEERLAYDFIQEIAGCVGMGIHSTFSSAQPFGTIANPNNRKRRLFDSLSGFHHVVDFTQISSGSRGVDLPWYVDVEAGLQQSNTAAENAYECIIDFLSFTGVLEATVSETNTREYEVFETVWKEPDSEYHFDATNFRRVAEGEVYATCNGTEIVADRPFYPVLFSDDGHESIFGYKTALQE